MIQKKKRLHVETIRVLNEFKCFHVKKLDIICKHLQMQVETKDQDVGIRYCYCEEEYDVSQDDMIRCDNCEEWFHYTCLKFTEEERRYWSSQETENIPWYCSGCPVIKESSIFYTKNKFLDVVAKEDSEVDKDDS